jgi:hypothetical protein
VGFHRIDKLDPHALMNVIASGAFDYSDVKARGGPCVIRASNIIALHFGHGDL